METKTTVLAALKQEVRLQEWSAQIEAQQASGMSIQQWCIENGVKPKTYYYHLKRVREQFLDSSLAIVPLNVPQQSSDIHIEKNGLQISLPADISPNTLLLWYSRYAERFANRSAGLPCHRLHGSAPLDRRSCNDRAGAIRA